MLRLFLLQCLSDGHRGGDVCPYLHWDDVDLYTSLASIRHILVIAQKDSCARHHPEEGS